MVAEAEEAAGVEGEVDMAVVPGRGEAAEVMEAVVTVAAVDMEAEGMAAAVEVAVGVTTVGKVGILLGSVARVAEAAGGMEEAEAAAAAAAGIVIAVVNRVTLQGTALTLAIDLVC